ncbi:MAG TPA: hypothetical protein VHN79_12995, partial [Lacunisphaera sp.]|nr:hypothetical protein [Lacunisphaera sp.]
MRLRLAFVLLLLGMPALRALDYGMTREQVVNELGKPATAVRRGTREVISYPNNVRIELENGKVAVIRGLEVVDGAFVLPGAAAPVAAPISEEKPAGKEADEIDSDAIPAKETPAEMEAVARLEEEAEKRYQEANTKALAEMEKAIGQMEALHDRSAEPMPEPDFDAVAFLIEVSVKWVLMLAALKLACKFWGYDTFWRSLLIAAAADTGVRVVVDLIGTHALGMMSLFYADEAIAAIALVLVLKKVSINQSTAFAVQITLTS